MKTKDINRDTAPKAKCDYCQRSFDEDKVYEQNGIGERYCKECDNRLNNPYPINPYSPEYVNNEY